MKIHTKILVYYIGLVTTSSVKTLYLIINKIKGQIEGGKRNKYVVLVPVD